MCIHQATAEFPDSFFFEKTNYDFDSPIASLNRLSVHPDYRLLGIAKEMFIARLAKAEALGCKTVVGVVTQNSERLYQSFEFTELGRQIFPIRRYGCQI